MTDYRVVELSLMNSCGVPYEWDGTTGTGEPVYIRWRSGYLAVSVGGDYGIDGQRVLEMNVEVLDHETPSAGAVLDMVDATDYIEIDDPDEVPSPALEMRYEKFEREHAVGGALGDA